MSIKKVENIDQLGKQGQKTAKALVVAVESYEKADNKRSTRLAEFLVACTAEKIILKQKHTAAIAKCDQSMVSRLYGSLSAYAEAHNDNWETGVAKLTEMGYTGFVEEFNPSTRTRKAPAKKGATGEPVAIAAKSEPTAPALQGVAHLVATLAAFNRALEEGKIDTVKDEMVDLELALAITSDLVHPFTMSDVAAG